MSEERFVVEADRKVVGIAVRVPGGYRFFSSDPAFIELEATTFPHAKTMAREVAELARLNRSGEGAPSRPGHHRIH